MLFGLENVDWAPIIINMFSSDRKLDKLWIENSSFPAYLPKDRADSLIAVRFFFRRHDNSVFSHSEIAPNR